MRERERERIITSPIYKSQWSTSGQLAESGVGVCVCVCLCVNCQLGNGNVNDKADTDSYIKRNINDKKWPMDGWMEG